ncbi:LacI family DNA-binding transcriptional regulator [Curtobacterium sp. NPDC087080]|uniref:LacI family DNA-binding transcriptional regulator n=1 Tax=Curtobacterium sp. NPDC087080 TaxID=3363965 RepID=UPI00380F6883
MARSTSIRDVAAEAGVSITTVSHALSGKGTVSARTRLRVEEAVERLGYAPNPIARAMRTDRRAVLGFVSEEIASTPYAGKIIVGAQAEAAAHDHVLMIVDIAAGEFDDPRIDALIQRQVDAVVFASASNRVIRLPRSLDPARTVLLDAFDPAAPVPSVVPDEQDIAVTAVRALLEAGHRRIAHLTVEGAGPAVTGRVEGYERTLVQAGRTPVVVRAAGEVADAAAGHRAATELFGPAPSQAADEHAGERPTAVFAFNDQMAMGVYQVAEERGMRIGRDLSVVGIDDLQIVAAALRPGLTTVALPHEQMGRAAVRRALEQTGALTAPQAPQTPRAGVERLRGELVVRGSIGPVTVTRS